MVKVLIVYAHEIETSFNAALKNLAVDVLRRNGHDVTVSDLYAMKFNPVTSRNDIVGPPSDSEHFRLTVEYPLALKNGGLAQDIVAEQKKVTEAELIIFQFPLFAMGMPAILKGWFDRVLLHDFIIDIERGRLYDQGLLKGRKAVLSLTTGGGPGWFTPDGIHGDLECTLWPIQNLLRFAGLEVLSPQISYSVGLVNEAAHKKMLTDWEGRLQAIMVEQPLKFPSISDFAPDNNPENPVFGLRLKEEYTKAIDSFGPTTGQHLGHLGKAAPTGSMIDRQSPCHPLYPFTNK